MKKIVVIVVLVLAALYAADLVSLEARLPRRDKLGAVTVHVLYAVKLKNGKTEYDDGGNEIVTCTNSVFPQLGYSPCWYVRRHPNQQITIDSGNPNNPHIF